VRTVLLVPRRADNGHRDELWTWALRRWREILPDVEVFEGHHDEGPFSRSAAVNTAARLAGAWDVGVVIDADVFVKRSAVLAAIAGAAAGRVTWSHRRWRGISEDWTRRILADRVDLGAELETVDLDVLVERTNPVSWSCCVAMPRSTFDALGGFDERFQGWGFEDMAFQSAVCGLFPWGRIEDADVYHLWHERSGERIVKGLGRGTARREYVVNARLGRRYMVALRRDHGLTDRLEPSGPAEMARDIANLMRDDAGYADVAKRYGLPDWSDWWPTLPELLAGAAAGRAGADAERSPVVTLVVHSGGTLESWPERRTYLRASLESLTERLHGPIVQRVLYSDWPDELRPELEVLAAEFGLYVAGDGHHGYSVSRARLWRYLERRAVGEYVFATEDDFLYDVDVELEPMIATLRTAPYLRQLALLRAPYYPRELEAGGILEEHPDGYETVRANGHSRVEHRLYFTANPSLIRRSLTATPWPTAASSERVYTDLLNRDKRSRFAYWGDGSTAVRHIGAVRAGDPASY
jgi:hypothetical protein